MKWKIDIISIIGFGLITAYLGLISIPFESIKTGIYIAAESSIFHRIFLLLVTAVLFFLVPALIYSECKKRIFKELKKKVEFKMLFKQTCVFIICLIGLYFIWEVLGQGVKEGAILFYAFIGGLVLLVAYIIFITQQNKKFKTNYKAFYWLLVIPVVVIAVFGLSLIVENDLFLLILLSIGILKCLNQVQIKLVD